MIQAAAPATIAALSVQYANAGYATDTWGPQRSITSWRRRSRSSEFAATPPARTTVRAPNSSAARAVLIASGSTIASWKAAARSAIGALAAYTGAWWGRKGPLGLDADVIFDSGLPSGMRIGSVRSEERR